GMIGASTGTISAFGDIAGLTWITRGDTGDILIGGNHVRLIEYYAKATATLSADTLTITLTGNTPTLDLTLAAVAGANFASPFDSHAGLPAVGTGNSGTASETVSSIYTGPQIIFGFTETVGCSAAGAGYTTIVCSGTRGSEYKTVTGGQTNLAVPLSISGSGTWAESADVVDANSAGCCGTQNNDQHWGMYLTTNATVPTQPNYSPFNDKQVALIMRQGSTSGGGPSGTFNLQLYLQRQQTSTIAS